MFNIGKLLSNPPKFVIEKNVNKTFNSKGIEENKIAESIYKIYCNKEIEYSINKYNNLMIKMNEDIKRKQDIKKILYGNDILIKTTNHSVNDLINNSKRYNFIFLVSFISTIGALIFYKSK
jgi:hypothetical protein